LLRIPTGTVVVPEVQPPLRCCFARRAVVPFAVGGTSLQTTAPHVQTRQDGRGRDRADDTTQSSVCGEVRKQQRWHANVAVEYVEESGRRSAADREQALETACCKTRARASLVCSAVASVPSLAAANAPGSRMNPERWRQRT
jgi:hypothetical protein